MAVSPAGVPPRIVTAPPHLGLGTQEGFREAANRMIDGAPPGTEALTIDLGETRTVDTVGLRVLTLIRRRAAHRRIAIRLVRVSATIQTLLAFTKLDGLFEIDAATAPDSS